VSVGRFAVWLLGCAAAIGCSDADHRLGGFAITGTGGSSGTSGPVSHDPCAQTGELDLIDDMEDGDGSIDTQGRAGVWFAFNDATAGAIQEPASNAEKFAMQRLTPPRGNSNYAAHTVGAEFIDWGAGIGFDLRVKKAYDASRSTGISFWARRPPGKASSLRLNVPDRNTSSLGGVCDEVKELCNDSFGAELELTTEWQLFSFEWSELSQRGWSTFIYPSIEISDIYGIRFQTDPFLEFEFEIDDIAFTCSG
jgi:hypothetical protein